MKKRLIAAVLILFAALNLSGQTNQDWKWQHPFPQGNIIRYTKVVDPQNWVMVAESGTFIKTTNGGANFTVATNAGTPTPIGNMQSKALYNGWFFDANTGMVCGASGYFARTTNGGTSWDTTITLGITNALYGIHFLNNSTGYLCGNGAKLFKTTNAGLNWTAITVTGFTTTMYNVFALDTNYIWTSLSNGRVGFTTNGGTTWNYPSATFGLSFAQDVNFINQNTGFACGNAGKVYYTTNGGFNWVANWTPGANTLYHLFTETSAPSTQAYFEGFEHPTLFPPVGWTNYNLSGNVVWMRSYWFHSGAQSAICAFQTTGGGDDWLVTPKWDIQSGDSLVFWLRQFLTAAGPDSLAVRVSTTDSLIPSFTTRILYTDQTSYPAVPLWKRYAVSLNAYAGQSIFIAFRHGDNNGGGILIDDVSIERYSTPTTNIYVTGDPYNIYRRTLTDTTWNAIPLLSPTQMWTSQYFSSSKLNDLWIAAGGQGLINVSTNAGANWSDKTFMISAGNRNDVWAESYDGRAITVGNLGATGANDQVMVTTNGGFNWTLGGITSSANFNSVGMVNSTTGYICGSSGEIQKTINGGANWTLMTTSIPSTEVLKKIQFIDQNTGWVFSNTYNASGPVWKTINGGVNWTQSNVSATDSIKIAGAHMIDANTGWVISTLPALTPRPYKTTDGGATWTRQDNYSGTWPSTLLGIFMLNANTGYITGGFSTNSLIKTTNGGANWEPVALPFTTGYNDVHFVNASFGIVAANVGLAAITTNGGTSWFYQNVNAGAMNACQMFTNGNSYVVGNGQTFPQAAIFKSTRIITGGIEFSNNVPEKFMLNQNYPNPFNPVTTIKFAIPRAANVSLIVYDVTGKEISRLINNAPLNAGTFDARFDGSSLASGIYFYKLIADGQSIGTKRMMMVK